MNGLDRAWPGAAAAAPRTRNALFEEDFDRVLARPPVPEPEVIAPRLSDAALSAARAEAWAEGYAAGHAEAQAAAGALAEAAAKLPGALEAAAAQASAEAEANAEALARVLIEMFATSFPALWARTGAAETRALLRMLLPNLLHQDDVEILVAPELADAVAEQVARAGSGRSQAAVQVRAAAGMRPGDLRVSWRRGSVTRDFAALWREMLAVLGAAGLPAEAATRELADVG